MVLQNIGFHDKVERLKSLSDIFTPTTLYCFKDGYMWEIDGNDITDKKCKLAANKRGLKQFGTERRLRDLKGKHFDLVVVGSVAVCPR